jgi:hypothetical protein
LILNVVYDLPFFRQGQRWLRNMFGGWTASYITQFQSGTPFSVATFDDFAGVGTGSGAQYWVVNGDPVLNRQERKFSNSTSDTNYWFAIRNVDGSPIFTRPPQGTFNSQSVRNIIYGPGFQNHSFALSKTFSLSDANKIQFRAEAYNWPNHPNWRAPGGDFVNPNSSTFGKFNGKQNERNIQFALRYWF